MLADGNQALGHVNAVGARGDIKGRLAAKVGDRLKLHTLAPFRLERIKRVTLEPKHPVVEVEIRHEQFGID